MDYRSQGTFRLWLPAQFGQWGSRQEIKEGEIKGKVCFSSFLLVESLCLEKAESLVERSQLSPVVLDAPLTIPRLLNYLCLPLQASD